VVDPVNGITREDAMCNQCNNLRGTTALQEFGGAGDGVRGVSKVVDEDSAAVGDGANKEQGCVLTIGNLSWAAFLGFRSGLGRY
jgi:hypothetical protein